MENLHTVHNWVPGETVALRFSFKFYVLRERIVVTALLMLYAGAEVAEKFFHDFAGIVMMPVAVLLMFGELWLMDKLTAPEPNPREGIVIRHGSTRIVGHRGHRGHKEKSNNQLD